MAAISGTVALITAQLRADVAPPAPPVGVDAYRRWDRWYEQRIGLRAYMASTYDRRGGNEGADASHFLFQTATGRSVPLDVEGPGVLTFVRTNHWHGSPWHYIIDGTDTTVTESSTADPYHPVPNSIFLPPGLFPQPLAWTWSATRGADLNWVPMSFTRSLRLQYGRTHYGTGYYIYDRVAEGSATAAGLRTWQPQPPPADVMALVGRAGTDLLPTAGSTAARRMRLRSLAGRVDVAAGRAAPLADIAPALPSLLRSLEIDAPRAEAVDLGRARLRITWDGRSTPSVDAPIALFFGAGTLHNRDGREYLVRALPLWVRYSNGRVHLACFFPMPFFRRARIEIVGQSVPLRDIAWCVRLQPLPDRPHWSYAAGFHATYRDHPRPALGRDLELLDTRGAEGSNEWSGLFVGTSFIFSHRAELSTLEGDPRFFFDDSLTPQAQGTGTEEWAGGGDYWGGENMTLPLAGHPTGASNAASARSAEDLIESAYRFLLADAMPFGRRARICLEHGGTDESTEHYETVAYWYGVPCATLVPSDSLHVGDTADERRHAYRSPTASPPYAITSRYEWGVDTLRGVTVYPASTDVGRVMRGASTFRLRTVPDNWGVMIRRKLDYAFPNQRAIVYVDAAPARARRHEWRRAGIWYLAGSNTCVYSNPRDELGAAQHVVETSNRRFRDDELLIRPELTRGRSRILVRVVYTPVSRPLFPGCGVRVPAGWSEIRYATYCYVAPHVVTGGRRSDRASARAQRSGG